MSTSATLSPNRLEQLVTQICASRRLTRQDQNLLMALAGQSGLSEQHLALVNSLYERLRTGFIRVVD